ncbi:AGAP010516-PA-like protein [Anopheles sinensis]|uniref:AGAP010516-PA-like protein n=1 Tax=Anopheles sinensis TaxID=74873 RepID=A0A084WAX4_ANOSI|nr:AGAP010516-PA-like protein [Anopheles sinensis]
MALNTPKRLKTAVSSCSNYLSTPPPSVTIGSPPTTDAQVGTAAANVGHGLTAPVTAHQQQQQHWNWFAEATSPSSSCSSPDGGQHNRSFSGHNSSGTPKTWSSSGGGGSAEKSENKRGRPRSEALTSLMVEGSISPSAIKCRYCHRVFPREKSLQAHLRTHTGERPYHCDYPGCTRAFTQSGQLKTHQRLHTGERPFICSAAHCQMRFTHANRHCPDHPYDTLRRCDDFVIQTVPEQNGEVLRWLEKYRAEREDRTPTRKTPKRSNGSNGVPATGSAAMSNGFGIESPGSTDLLNETENQRPTATATQRSSANDENNPTIGNGLLNGVAGGGSGVGSAGNLLLSPITPNNNYKSSRKGLMCELDMNAGLGSPLKSKTKNALPKLIQWQEPTDHEEEEEEADESGDELCPTSSPAKSTFNPKKKWLRDAWQDDLAKPLEPNVISQKVFSSTTSTMALKQQLHQQPEVPVSTTTYSSSPVKRQALAPAGHHNKPLPRVDSYSNGLSTIDPNQMRPTVLMVASKDSARPLSDQPASALHLTNGAGKGAAGPKPEENNRKLQGALALMQLATKEAYALATAHDDSLLSASESIGYGYDDVSPASSVPPDSSTASSPEGPILPRTPFDDRAPNGLGSYL